MYNINGAGRFALPYFFKKERKEKIKMEQNAIKIEVQTTAQVFELNNDFGETLKLIAPMSANQFIELSEIQEQEQEAITKFDSIISEAQRTGDLSAMKAPLAQMEKTAYNLFVRLFNKSQWNGFKKFLRNDSIFIYIYTLKILKETATKEPMERLQNTFETLAKNLETEFAGMTEEQAQQAELEKLTSEIGAENVEKILRLKK